MACNGVHQCEYCQEHMCCSDSDLISAYRKLVKALEKLCEARRNSGYGSIGVITQIISVRSCKNRINELET